MKIASNHVLATAALLAVVFVSGCDQDRGNGSGTAAETSVMPTTTDATDPPATAAGQGQTSADAYATAAPPVDPNGASTSNPMNPDAPMSNDPGATQTQTGEMMERNQDQPATQGQGDVNSGMRDGTGKPTPGV